MLTKRKMLLWKLTLLCVLLILSACSNTNSNNIPDQLASPKQELESKPDDTSTSTGPSTEIHDDPSQVEENEDQELGNHESFVSIVNQQLQLKGIALWMTSDEVHGILGEPKITSGSDGFYENSDEYEEGNLFIGYYNDKVLAVHYSVKYFHLNQIDIEGIIVYTDGDYTYIYHEESESLIKVTNYEENIDLALLGVDNNFHNAVEQGWFTPVELP